MGPSRVHTVPTTRDSMAAKPPAPTVGTYLDAKWTLNFISREVEIEAPPLHYPVVACSWKKGMGGGGDDDVVEFKVGGARPNPALVFLRMGKYSHHPYDPPAFMEAFDKQSQPLIKIGTLNAHNDFYFF